MQQRNTFIAIGLIVLGFTVCSVIAAFGAGESEEVSNPDQPRFGLFQGKGANTRQITTRAKAGGSVYVASRYVNDPDCLQKLKHEGGNPKACEQLSTVIVEMRKDTNIAGFSGRIIIDNEKTMILIGADVASGLGSDQIREQGLADGIRVTAIGDAVGSVASRLIDSATNPALPITDVAEVAIETIVNPE